LAAASPSPQRVQLPGRWELPVYAELRKPADSAYSGGRGVRGRCGTGSGRASGPDRWRRVCCTS